MCNPVSDVAVNLPAALGHVQKAITDLQPLDLFHRTTWTPTESLLPQRFECSVTTLADLRKVLQPLLHSPEVHASHTTCSPQRTVLEYTDAQGGPQHFLITPHYIKNAATGQACAMNYRLAYYTMTALGSLQTPAFADNAFDASVASYLRCLDRDSRQVSCDHILKDHAEDIAEEWAQARSQQNKSDYCEKTIQSETANPRMQQVCFGRLRDQMVTVSELLQHYVSDDRDLTPELRRSLQAGIQESQRFYMSDIIPDTSAGLRARFSQFQQGLSALLQTPVGRIAFWELRTQLPVTCTVVEDPETTEAPQTETVRCNFSGVDISERFVTNTTVPARTAAQK